MIKRQYIGNCVNNPFKDVNELSDVIDGGVEITKETFYKNVDVDDETKQMIRQYPNDFVFYKNSKYNVYFFENSMIEHFYM